MVKIKLFIEPYLKFLSQSINRVLQDLEVNTVGPTFRKRENNTTLSYNIYPLEMEISELWTILHTALKNNFTELSKKGEVIMYTTTQGGILDQGVEYFKVVNANIFECYIYEPESFIYARILQEFDIIKKNRWISIDVDGIERSAWFEE